MSEGAANLLQSVFPAKSGFIPVEMQWLFVHGIREFSKKHGRQLEIQMQAYGISDFLLR